MTVRDEESLIARELVQKRPFRNAGTEASMGILRTADILRRRIEVLLVEHDITLQQYNVLRILRGAGAEGLHTLAIAERMVERAPGITRLLDRLEARGLVDRERRTDDRRCVVCRLTRAGTKLMAELDPVIEAEEDRLGALLAAKQWRELIALLDALRSAL